MYYYANTCADFESQLRTLDLELDWDEVADLARAHDVAVPLIHGEFGEDGVLQQRLEEWGVPYVFSRPDALARTLDKEACYAALSAAGFPVPAHRPVTRDEWALDRAGVLADLCALAPTLGPISERDRSGRLLAVKPLTGGSSFGVDVVPASEARRWPTPSRPPSPRPPATVIVEEFLGGTEFSVVVLDGPGGVPDGAGPHRGGEAGGQPGLRHRGEVPGRVGGHPPHPDAGGRTPSCTRSAGEAADAYGVLGLRHMARIDGFWTDDGTVVVIDVNGISGMGFSSFVFQQAAMVGLDHRRLIMGLLRAALGQPDVTAEDAVVASDGARRIHVVLGGPTSERQVSRQSGCFVGLSLLASGSDVRFYLMDLQSRYVEIGLFYVLHHDVEEIHALVGDPLRRATVESVGAAVRADFAMGDGGGPARPCASGTPSPWRTWPSTPTSCSWPCTAGQGEDGRLQLALDRLGTPYNGSRAAGRRPWPATRRPPRPVSRDLGLPGVEAPGPAGGRHLRAGGLAGRDGPARGRGGPVRRAVRRARGPGPGVQAGDRRELHRGEAAPASRGHGAVPLRHRDRGDRVHG